MKKADKTLRLINDAIEQRQEDGRRTHLGASLIGRKCPRQLWYIWRWARGVQHTARLLRLFDRGHREEARFIEWQRNAGIEVWPFQDEATQTQWRISGHGGHFGGSLDGIARGFPEFPTEYCVNEYKTHNQKSFDNLVSKGVQVAKPEHYTQSQIYMHGYQLRYTLYFAACKNDDDIHVEVIEYNAPHAASYWERAGQIIASDRPPNRISNTPGWHECRFCDFPKECFFKQEPEKNCRTCSYSRPADGGQWLCLGYNVVIPDNVMRVGCSSYERLATWHS